MTVLKELKGMPNPQGAFDLLERLMKHTAPMRARRPGWNLQELKEFYPKNPGYLGVNVNRCVICVRLRSPTDKTSFLSWESLLGTMVHELTHMEVGNHSAQFYTLMDSLYTEVEKDEDSGLIHRFDGSKGMAQNSIPATGGNVLGGKSAGTGGGAAAKNARQIAEERAAAAERRKKNQTLEGSGVLGNSNRSGTMGSKHKPAFDMSTKEGRRAAMAWAAEKRQQDNEACPSGSQEDMGFDDDAAAAAAAAATADDFAPAVGKAPSKYAAPYPSHKTANTSDDRLAKGRQQQVKRKASSLSSSSSSSSSPSSSIPNKERKVEVVDLTSPPNPTRKTASSSNDDREHVRHAGVEGWPCPTCTYENRVEVQECGICGLPPFDIPASRSLEREKEKEKKETNQEDFDVFKSNVASGHRVWK